MWYNLGALYEACNNQTSDALDAFTRALELDPRDSVLADRVGLLKNCVSGIPGSLVPVPLDPKQPRLYIPRHDIKRDTGPYSGGFSPSGYPAPYSGRQDEDGRKRSLSGAGAEGMKRQKENPN